MTVGETRKQSVITLKITGSNCSVWIGTRLPKCFPPCSNGGPYTITSTSQRRSHREDWAVELYECLCHPSAEFLSSCSHQLERISIPKIHLRVHAILLC